MPRFARRSTSLDWGGLRRRTARVATATVGDVIARWISMYGYRGVGLVGGAFTTTGGAFTARRPVVRWRLHDVRWVDDVAVSGTMRWKRATGAVEARLRVSGPGAARGRLTVRWNDWEPTATAVARGMLVGEPVRFSFGAP